MLRQTSYIFAANVAGYGIRILLPIFLVRALSKADFGSYNQFFLLEVMFKTIFQMGVSQSLFYFVPKDEKNGGGYFINSIILNTVLFLVAYSLIAMFREPIAGFLKMAVLTDFFWHLASYSLLLLLQVCATNYLMARKLFRQAAVLEVGNQVLFSVASLIAAILTRDLKIVIAALVAARCASLVVVMIYILIGVRGFRSDRYFFGMGDQIRYGVVLGSAGMLWTLLTRMHELAVSKFFPLETYAVYAAGSKQIPVLQFFTQAITPVALVQFAQFETENRWREMRELWDRILGMMFGFGIPLTVFFIVIAKPLVTFMFTQEYAAAVPIFQIAAVAQLHQMLNPARVLRAMDRNDISVKIHLVMVLLLPGALLAGRSLAGLTGIIAAHAAVVIGGRMATVYVLNRIAPTRFSYLASWDSVWAFYTESWRKIASYASRFTR